MYLSEKERVWAPTLWKALQVGKQTWESERGKATGRIQGINEKVTGAAADFVNVVTIQAEKEGVAARLDYMQLNWADTLEPVGDIEPSAGSSGKPGWVEERAVILSGAMWVGRTRLIDNIILGREDVVNRIIF
jgi:pantoate--beta-alanine ligase